MFFFLSRTVIFFPSLDLSLLRKPPFSPVLSIFFSFLYCKRQEVNLHYNKSFLSPALSFITILCFNFAFTANFGMVEFHIISLFPSLSFPPLFLRLSSTRVTDSHKKMRKKMRKEKIGRELASL